MSAFIRAYGGDLICYLPVAVREAVSVEDRSRLRRFYRGEVLPGNFRTWELPVHAGGDFAR